MLRTLRFPYQQQTFPELPCSLQPEQLLLRLLTARRHWSQMSYPLRWIQKAHPRLYSLQEQAPQTLHSEQKAPLQLYSLREQVRQTLHSEQKAHSQLYSLQGQVRQTLHSEQKAHSQWNSLQEQAPVPDRCSRCRHRFRTAPGQDHCSVPPG